MTQAQALTAEEFREVIGQRIVAMRTRHTMMQVTLAHAIGVSQSALSTYERGTREQPVVALLQIARFFGEPLAALVSESDVVMATNGE